MEKELEIFEPKYINPYTDFGFKKLFGEEASKDLLLDFLNTLLPPDYKIVDLEFRNSETFAEIPSFRKAIFDIHCENQSKDKFVVEMQKSKLEYFKDRVIWYMSFPIRNQAPKGKILKIVKNQEKESEWDFNLKPVYFVGILDFEFADVEDGSETDYVVEVEYKDQNNKVFYNKLKYFFIIMPRFNKKADELISQKDKWIYFLKNLTTFDEIPQILNEPIFQKGFEIAKISNFDKKQLQEYEESYNDYLGFINSLDYSFKKGKIEGEIEGEIKGEIKGKIEGKEERNIEIAIEMIKDGESNEKIKKYTGLTDEKINELRKKLNIYE